MLDTPNKKFINLINKTNLEESAIILRNSCLYFGNDSSMLYLAAAMGIHTIGLFGPTQFIAANPLGDKQIYLEGKVYCSPCYNPYEGIKGRMYTCDNNICMQSISPNLVKANQWIIKVKIWDQYEKRDYYEDFKIIDQKIYFYLDDKNVFIRKDFKKK